MKGRTDRGAIDCDLAILLKKKGTEWMLKVKDCTSVWIK